MIIIVERLHRSMERLEDLVADDHRRSCHGTWIPRENPDLYSCTCGYDTRQEDLLEAVAGVIERLRGELVNREEQVARLKRERMLAMEGRTVHGGWSDVGNKP